MKQYVIGVDVGTGSTKGVAVDMKGNTIATSQFYYSGINPQPGFFEEDPEKIWQAFVKCINEIVKKIKQPPVAVSLSSAMHSLMVTDKKNKAITTLMTWADTRSEKIAEGLRNSPAGKKLYAATGTPIHSMSPLCKIKWFKENDKKIFTKAFKFISIKEFIWFRLFNKYEIDYSIASATGLFNIKKLQWNAESLGYCGIGATKLSKPVATNFTRNKVKPAILKNIRLSPDTRFCIGASDGCLANLGSDAIDPGIAALTIGTSGAVRIAGSRPVINYDRMIFNYLLDETTFISGGPVNNGGNVLKWMFNTFLNNLSPSDNDYRNIFKQIESIPAGSKGLIFLPYLYGERAPVWDERASGVFFNVQSFHTNAHFFRAALEGICFALNTILEILEASTKPIQQLNVSGGFVHSKIWMQILADITGKKVCLVQLEDASSIGAALVGMKSLKIISDYALLKERSFSHISPDHDNIAIYKKYSGIYKNLYSLLKPSMHKMYKINV